MAGIEEEMEIPMLANEEKSDLTNGDQGHVEEEREDNGQTVDKTHAKPEVHLFLTDNPGDHRRIDFILAWSPELEKKLNKHEQETAEKARKAFEAALKLEGLELEHAQEEAEDKHCFTKVHAPIKVLKRYADILKLRMPMKVTANVRRSFDTYCPKDCTKPFQHGYGDKSDKTPFSLPYTSDREYLFKVPENAEELFSHANRNWIVDYILRRQSFATKNDQSQNDEKDHTSRYGIRKMIKDGYYTAAYPLHEGHWESEEKPCGILHKEWALWKNFYKFQPLGQIRGYFGEKIALYFAWLGFYSTMLIPASIVGVIVFIYGLAIMSTNIVTDELCDPNNNFTMCPQCDGQCPYWKLNIACSHVRASRMFDNDATVFFAIFMSLWGTIFLEFWKRKQAVIQHKWGLSGFVPEEEPPRPEYLSKKTKKTKDNTITGNAEPYLPFWKIRLPRFFITYSVLLVMAAVILSVIVGVIGYRISVMASLYLAGSHVESKINSTLVIKTAGLISEHASLLTTATAALINLFIILVLGKIYRKLTIQLTDWECLRTQSEYDSSITIKLFVIQFVNIFSSIIYIAFFKGQFLGRPGKYTRILGGRQEECDAGGCLIELCVQLSTIMVGKQLIQNNIIGHLVPTVKKFIKKKWSEFKKHQSQEEAKSQWEKDYHLKPLMNMSLCNEYLDMVLQFGFLTMFCAAFPLAPLFALLNNIVELRADARKFTSIFRRPVAEKSATIGIWYDILFVISRIAVISNAFLIAFSSEFIPRLVYTLKYSEDKTLHGYMNFTLAYFNTSDFKEGERPYGDAGEITMCRYKDFRNPPWFAEEDKIYWHSETFWHILAVRLAFVCVFENVVVGITSFIAWLIPDIPKKLKETIRRDTYITNEITLKIEQKRGLGMQITDKLVQEISEEVIKRYPTMKENQIGDVKRGKNDGGGAASTTSV